MNHTMHMEVSSESGISVIRFTIDGHTCALGVRDIDEMIMQLAAARAAMQPTHPPEPPDGRYPLQVDPCWRVDRLADYNGAVLSMRHIGIGWIAFALPSVNLMNLVEALVCEPEASTPMNRAMLN
ncbi:MULTISPECIES: hypothetical protein [Burkholderia]|uniref:hypothetical protein n=1 Tax=Burkholderia TaxID=32008 RepID=UPI000F5D64EB|nr:MULTISPECIES: hypothetical protein [Burkholderia]MBY4869542.1 hypothetical protein [Burkholderia anthina]